MNSLSLSFPILYNKDSNVPVSHVLCVSTTISCVASLAYSMTNKSHCIAVYHATVINFLNQISKAQGFSLISASFLWLLHCDNFLQLINDNIDAYENLILILMNVNVVAVI